MRSYADGFSEVQSTDKFLRDSALSTVAGAPAADLAVLAALVGDDPGVINEVLQAFRESAEQSSAEVRQGIIDGLSPVVVGAAHKLKSGARAIGAQRLGELCAEIEHMAEAGNVEALAGLLPIFNSELSAVYAVLDSR